jgi:hypothetical protein
MTIDDLTSLTAPFAFDAIQAVRQGKAPWNKAGVISRFADMWSRVRRIASAWEERSVTRDVQPVF